MALVVGEEFEDYDSFKAKIAEIERNTNSVFIIDQCTSVQKSNKSIAKPEKRYREVFKYRYVKLVCKHYGTVRRTANRRGKPRPNQS